MSNRPIDTAQIVRRPGTIADVPPLFSLAEMLLGREDFKRPKAYKLGTLKNEKWCRACHQNHLAIAFVMDDGSISPTYCKVQRLRIIAKKEAIRVAKGGEE